MIHDPFDDDAIVNPSSGPTLAQVIEARMSRRTALKGLAAAGAIGLVGCASPTSRSATGGAPLTFTEIGRFLDETHHAAPGHDVQVLIRWGDPIYRAGPQFKPGAQTAAEQEVQFGMDNDFIAFMPLPRGSRNSSRGLLCVNHERNTPHLSWPGMTATDYTKKMTREQCDVEMASQGHTIIEIARYGDAWRLVDDNRHNRHITARSAAIRVAGPAAVHPRMRTMSDPDGTTIIGTLNNCAGGVTPWGTVLTGEENLQNYFTGDPAKGHEAAAWKRYGINGRGR